MQTSRMALQHVVHRFGTKGSNVTVTLQGGGNAPLFSDAAGTISKPNPVPVLANGVVEFYVDTGTYVMTESGKGTDKRTFTVGEGHGVVVSVDAGSDPDTPRPANLGPNDVVYWKCDPGVVPLHKIDADMVFTRDA